MKRTIVAGLILSVLGVQVAPAQTEAQPTKPAPRAGSTPRRAPGAARAGKPAAKPPAKVDPAALSEDEKALFALGAQMGEQARAIVERLRLKPSELQAFKNGMSAGIDGTKSPYPFEQYQPRLSARASAGAAQETAANRERGAAFRDAAAAEPGATRTSSGLVFKSLQPGSGEAPKATDTVRVRYRGTLVDGTEFDASRGGPASFPLNGVVPCWTEGLQLMKVGERARLVCPPEIAYGDRPQGRIPAGSTLVFEVELAGIGAESPESPR